MIVEIKSILTQRDVDQMKRKMENVFKVMPEHKNKIFYGMIAYVSGHTDLKKQIIENGWYLAQVDFQYLCLSTRGLLEE